MIPTIQEFLASGRRNAWVRDGQMNLFVRRSTRAVQSVAGPRVVQAFDLANMEQPQDLRGQGRLWALIEQLDRELPSGFQILYIESVLNDRLAASLRARPEWIEVQGSTPPTFFRWRAGLDKRAGGGIIQS